MTTNDDIEYVELAPEWGLAVTIGALEECSYHLRQIMRRQHPDHLMPKPHTYLSENPDRNMGSLVAAIRLYGICAKWFAEIADLNAEAARP